jgi:hypothetical protein
MAKQRSAYLIFVGHKYCANFILGSILARLRKRAGATASIALRSRLSQPATAQGSARSTESQISRLTLIHSIKSRPLRTQELNAFGNLSRGFNRRRIAAQLSTTQVQTNSSAFCRKFQLEHRLDRPAICPDHRCSRTGSHPNTPPKTAPENSCPVRSMNPVLGCRCLEPVIPRNLNKRQQGTTQSELLDR